jgi:hypothetical protein
MDFFKTHFLTDPQTATGDPSHPEVFHYTWQWLAVCGIILLVWFYYQVEGRKRFFGTNWLLKGIFDKMLNQYGLIAFVGPFIWFARVAMDSSFFSWRLWRYGWLLWLVVVTGYWAYYFAFRYKAERDSYRAYQIKQQYIPQSKGKRSARGSARAGAR